MALWNRSSYLMIARILPIVLVLSAGFFWKYEKHVRIQAEKRLKTVSEQLIQSQNDLALTRKEADSATEEKRFLIQQLGERDEHIRRLLAEMIQLLSGSGPVDLGEVLVRSQTPGAWDGVRNEMRNITSQSPLTAPIQAMPSAAGLGQMQVEQQALPSGIRGMAITTSAAQGAAAGNASVRNGQILTVNGEHRFVVISQGSQNGLKESMLFDAYSGDRKIGRLQVGTVYDRIATASILDGETGLFREGGALRLEPASA